MTMPYVLFCSLFFFTNFFFFLLLDDEDDDHHRCRLLITSSCPPPLPSNARRGWVVLFFKTPLDNNEYPPLACDCMSFLLVCLLSLTTNDNDGACPNPLAFGSESGFPSLPRTLPSFDDNAHHYPSSFRTFPSFDDNAHPTPSQSRGGLFFLHFICHR